jgi:hypothetical protein
MRSSRVAVLCIATAVLAGGIAREAACRHGLPYVLYWDEYGVLGAALHMWKDRTIDPGFYGYGALLTYATLLWEMPVLHWLQSLPPTDPRALISPEALQIGGMDGLAPETSHPELYYAARLLVAVIGTATIGTTAMLARRMAGPWAGAIAAWVLAGSIVHLVQSGLSVPNVPLAFFATLVAWKTLDAMDTGRGLRWAAVFAGAAFGCKVPGILTLALPLTALVLTRAPRRDWFAVLTIPVAVFALTNPMTVVAPGALVADLRAEVDQYYGGLEPGPPPGSSTFSMQIDQLGGSLGLAATLLAALGIVALVRRRHGWILWLLPLVVVAFFATPRVAYPRNLVMAYPFLAACTGAAIALVAERLTPRAAVAWWVVASLLVVGRASSVIVSQTNQLPEPDARTRIVTALAEQHARVAVPTEVRVHQRDLARLDHPVVAPLRDLACTSVADVVIVPPAFWSDQHPATASLLNRIIGTDPESNPGLFSLGWTSWVPELRALPLPLPGCEGFVPFSALDNPNQFPTYDSILAMLWNGRVALALPTPPPGRYEIVWELLGITHDGEPARVRLSTPREGSTEASLASDWQLLRRTFDVDASTDLTAVQLEFLNDGATPEIDRDVAVGRVWLRPVRDSRVP